MQPTRRFYWIARISECLVGLFFVAGALLKAVDINLFSVQISYYGVVKDQTILDTIAVAVIGLETLLGACLLLGIRLRGLVHGAVACLLIGFTGLIAYAWTFHGLKDCGCMGSLEMTPGISIIKNVVLFGLLGVAAGGLRKSVLPPSQTPLYGRRARFLVAAMAAVGVAVYGYAHLEPAAAPTTAPGRFSEFVFDAGGQHWDLGKGDYFVAVLSSTCPDCRASVPALNDLMVSSDTPPMVALIEGTPEDIADFESTTQPLFPLHPVSLKTFFSLIDPEPPFFYLVHNGAATAVWGGAVPTVSEISDALNK